MEFVAANSALTPARIKFDTNFPPALMRGTAESREDMHEKLLSYLKARLDSARVYRIARLQRMARIDKQVSTWQQLSDQDTQRRNIQENTGKSQAIHMNMPVLHSHMEDMTSFFAEVFSPGAGDFFQLPKADTQAAARTLVDKLNNDAKMEKYYKELILTLRRILKYNVGGFEVDWTADMNQEDNEGRNRYSSIDLYNYLYDPAITDPSLIAKKAEWAARVAIRDQRYLLEMQQKQKYYGIGEVIKIDDENKFVNQMTNAEYYRYSPAEAGLTYDDEKTRTGDRTVDWEAYGAGLNADRAVMVPGWEEIRMYCWINPYEFGLAEEDPNDYQLWNFTILSGCRIIQMEPVFDGTAAQAESTGDFSTTYRQIPHYLGFLNVDDMGESQRSVAELLAPFASFASFLLNSKVDGVRSAIYGFTIYDPMGIDMDSIPKGEVAARVRSKMPGRDVREIVQTINGNMPTNDTMNDLASLMQIMKEFFPAQALPNQIAGIDRAVTNQVQAVLQGVNRRLHMAVRIIDDDIMGPARFMSFINIVRNNAAVLTGLDDKNVMTILGSGLQQLNRDVAAAQIKELIFAMLQNPDAMQGTDMMGLINWWSGMLNIPEDLSQFQKQATPQNPTTPTGAPPVVTPTV